MKYFIEHISKPGEFEASRVDFDKCVLLNTLASAAIVRTRGEAGNREKVLLSPKGIEIITL